MKIYILPTIPIPCKRICLRQLFLLFRIVRAPLRFATSVYFFVSRRFISYVHVWALKSGLRIGFPSSCFFSSLKKFFFLSSLIRYDFSIIRVTLLFYITRPDERLNHLDVEPVVLQRTRAKFNNGNARVIIFNLHCFCSSYAAGNKTP